MGDKKDEKKDDKKDEKKDDKKDDKKDEKKPAAKTDDKKDEKKPAAAGMFSWTMTTKIGEVTAMESWNAYEKIPQAVAEADITMTNACMSTEPFKRFYNKMMFGKLNDQGAEQNFKVFFETLKVINDDLSNPHAKMMFDKLMGK